MTYAAPHACSGIGCEYCISIDVLAAKERDLMRKATPKRGKKAKLPAYTGPKTLAELKGINLPESESERLNRVINNAQGGVIRTDNVRDYANAKFPQPNPSPAPETPQQQPLDDGNGPFIAAPGNLRTAEAALKFVLAGNAYFTVRSLKTGDRYTFRVNQPKKDRDQFCSYCKQKPCRCSQPYFVALLTGPDNESDYTYLGMLKDNVFRLTRASKLNPDSKPVRAFRWVFEHLIRREFPPQCEVWHEGRCGVCGRPLTVPESIASGIGPVCAEGGM